MSPFQVALTRESEELDVFTQTPRRAKPPSQPGSRTRRPISPQPLSRQATGSARDESVAPITASPRSNRGSAQKPARDETSFGPSKPGLANTPPSSHTPQSSHRTPKTQTPRKADWTVEKIEDRLRKFSQDIAADNAKLTSRLLQLSWKNDAPERRFISKKNWLAGMKRTPSEGGKDCMKIKTKHIGQGRSGKQEKRELHHVICIKTNKEAVPNYGFHHVEISKNILSPNTMLNFVPHLRDLADNEENVYRHWLENLEAMDETSGFATLSRQQKVNKTIQKERATTLLLYLDSWLDSLSIDHCTKSTLIRHMANQSDTVTPQQKTSILNSYTDESGSPGSARAVRMFTEAFDRVFNDASFKETAVVLRDVLLLDKSVDNIVDSKKWMKDTPSQTKVVEEHTTVETFLETYALLGCLVCSSHSCEHGEYGDDNERKRFSVEVVGGVSPMLRQIASRRRDENGEGSPIFRRARRPCGEDCYLNGRPGTRARAWNETETMLLKSFFLTLGDTAIPIQCATAVATGRPCWDVSRQLDKLDLTPPVASPAAAPAKVRTVPWYDRHKKLLLGDWQDHIITHEHQKKDHFDPCSHDGPCTMENCDCVRAGLLCERFCRCTAECCAYKFTGCACHSLGKTCQPKQKDQRPCICIQLNRECDPGLCGSCGAKDRANPRNADNDELYTTGCQNCSLQRARPRSLVLGKSLIPDCGYGLFAAEDIPADEFVIEYVGELISQDEGVRREARRGDVFDEESNTSYLFTLLEQEGIWVDAAIYGNLSRYINHQDDADKGGWGCNVTPKILYVNGEYRIKFTSMRDIKAGDEIFFNYGENFPNLTKKLLNEQKEGEKVKKRRGKAKAQNDNNEGDAPRGKLKGPAKKRGRKGRPPKKTFGKQLESEIDDEAEELNDDDDDDGGDPFRGRASKSRKRKRGRAGSDSEEGEYRPGRGNSMDGILSTTNDENASSKGRGKKRPSSAKAKKGPSFTASGARRGRPPKVRPELQAEQEPEPKTATPKDRPRKQRRLADSPSQEAAAGRGEDEEQDEIRALGSGSRSRILGSGRRGGGGTGSGRRQTREEAEDVVMVGSDSDSAAEEDTPSKVRTRKHEVEERPEAVESSPLSALDQQFENRSSAIEDVSMRVSFRNSQQDKNEDADMEMGNAGRDNEEGQDSFGDWSDDDNVVDRARRSRKMPSRYED